MCSYLQESLIVHGQLTQAELTYTQGAARGTPYTWLELLLVWGFVDEAAIVDAIEREHFVPQCDLARLAALPADVLLGIPPELAIEHRLVPLRVERDGDLGVAMVDPTDDAAFAELSSFTDRRVLREVAPASAVAWALHAYYGADTPLWPPATVARPGGGARRLARGSITSVAPNLR